MDDIKVSVIIPVYNVENYLEQCLNSIVNQSLREIEIICIDDGSTDRSPEILREFQDRDPRVMIHTESNSGCNAARNYGMRFARGKYLMFWDADDYFNLTALEKLYQKSEASDSDICVCGKTRILESDNGDKKYDVLPNKKFLQETMPFNIQTNPDYILNFSGNTNWDKMYRREFIEKNKLQFPTEKRGGDAYFCSVALCLAENITVLNQVLVYYRSFREDSLSSTLSENPYDPISGWLKTKKTLQDRGVFPERSFANCALASVLHIFCSIRFSHGNFTKLFNQLQNGDLQKLSIELREPGYYYEPWQEKLVPHLLSDSADEFLTYYLYIIDTRLKEKISAKQKAEKKLKKQRKAAQLESEQHQAELKTAKKESEKYLAKLEAANAELEKLQAQVGDLQKQNSDLKKKNKELKNSRSYKIGSGITYIPRKLKNLTK